MSDPAIATNELLTRMAKALATREAAAAWVAGLSPEELARAWAACPDGRALVRLAAPAVETKALVRVACACLRFALDQKKGHHRIRAATKALEQWTHGAAAWSDVERARDKATERDVAEDDLSSALVAATGIPADPTRAEAVVDALALALSNEDVVYRASSPSPAPARKTRVGALAQLAEIVRGALPCPATDALTRPA